jgi:hypothetical protein
MLKRVLRGLHASLVLMPIQPYGRERRVAVDVHGISRVLKHPAALAVTLHDLTGHSLAGCGPECGVATLKQQWSHHARRFIQFIETLTKSPSIATKRPTAPSCCGTTHTADGAFPAEIW